MERQSDLELRPFSAGAMKQRIVFWSGTILVGLCISALSLLSEQTAAEFRQFVHHWPWTVFLVCPLGMAAIVGVMEYWFPGSERSGVPQVKAALSIQDDLTLRGRLVSLRIAAGKVILTNLSLLAGASAGLGGPAIQIGASIMTSLGRLARFPPHYLERGFILAGSAAGFAALFSAPLAGIMFAIEELGRSLEERIESLVLTAIIFAGITAYVILNQYVFLDTAEVQLMDLRNWWAIPVCGVLGGFCGGMFSWLLIQSYRRIARLGRWRQIGLALACGLVVAGLGYASQDLTFGTGYPMLKQILTHPENMPPLYPLQKGIAVFATALSGVPAGLFVPSLTVGAGLGADLSHWLPLTGPLVMILLTMTAYFSGILRSPMTAFVLVMEITDTHNLLLPMMATAFIAAGTSHLLNPVSLYQALTENYAQESSPRT
ncbi:MAG: chloride channel protein [Methylohalobius sp. ZOD2]